MYVPTQGQLLNKSSVVSNGKEVATNRRLQSLVGSPPPPRKIVKIRLSEIESKPYLSSCVNKIGT